jgi:hypothetical protein
MRLYLLLVLFSLTSCFNVDMDCHGQFKVDPAFSPLMRANVYESGRRWNEFSFKKVTLRDGTGDVCTIQPTYTGSPVYQHIEARKGSWFAAVNRPTGNIYICIDYTEDPLHNQSALLHEFGHTVYMEHLSEPGIMWEGTLETEFSEADRGECRRVNACH